MNALALLYEHKIDRLRRLAYMYVGYESDSEAVSEKLYGVYIVLLLLAAGLFMLAWVVVNVGKVLSIFNLPLQSLEELVFAGMTLWLVSVVFRAVNTYDLQQFELSDLDFLCQAPLSKALINLLWWVRSLFKRTIGGFVLVCALLSSLAAYISHGNDIEALIIGGFAAALFIIVSSGLRWVIGLLRYLPNPRLNPFLGFGISLVLLVVAFTPVARYVFWPASLASWLLVGRAIDENVTFTVAALAGMLVMTGLGFFLIFLLGRASQLAPALEEGSLGGRFRLAAKVDKASAGEAALLYHLGRRLQSGRGGFKEREAGADFLTGPFRTVLLRQWLRLRRLPVTKLLLGAALPLGIGLVGALLLALLAQLNATFIVRVQVVFLANYILLRAGVGPLRRELAHPDMLINWPVSRLQISVYYLILGFVTPLVSGEIGLALGFVIGMDRAVLLNWQLLWLGLVGATFMIALAFFKHGLGKWSGNPLDVPNAGPLAVIVCGIVWAFCSLSNLTTGLMGAAAVILGALYFISMDNS